MLVLYSVMFVPWAIFGANIISVNRLLYTPNANMADHSVGARDESNGSEASEALMFCFENASPGNSCFVVDLFRFISLCLRVAVFLKATRRDRNLPPFTS